ncbi:MAG: hypothetical protein ACTHJ5_13470 [Ilyomonas sp.]
MNLLKIKVAIYFILLVCFTTNVLKAQRIDSTLNIYATQYQHERAYIQFDKPAYSPGETIWFKTYLMAGISPSDISKTLYVDFADADGKVLTHSTFPITESSAKGSFEIPSDLRSSFIHVRAYTQWMLNFDSAFLYNKSIRIIQQSPPKNPNTTNVASIQFFPEGGDAIKNIESRVAFKATDQTGKPVEVYGVVVNSKGAVVDSFKSVHDGMGSFLFTAKPGETYTAKWVDQKKNQHTTPLPAAKTSGATLSLSKVGDGKEGFIVRRSDNATENLKQFHIVATMHQQVVYMANLRLEESPMIGGVIPVAQLPTGILQVTLFDNDWAPLAERIAFVNNGDAVFTPEVGFSKLGLNKRGQSVLEINMPDSLSANLSIVVTDAGIGSDSSDNIITHLLLTGELKGSVYKPEYYFSDNSDSVINHLDLVMLTNGWRRFNWQKIVKGELPEITYPKDTAYLSLAGKVYGATPTQIRSAGDIFLFLEGKDSSQQTADIPIKPDGSFNDPGIIFFDSVKVFYQFLKNKAFADMSEVRFNMGLPSPRRVNFDKTVNIAQWLDTVGNYRNQLLTDEKLRTEQLLKGTTLQGVTVQSKTKSSTQIMDEKYTSGLFSGSDAYQFDVTKDFAAQSAQNVFNYLQGRVAGLQISVSSIGGTASLTWRGSPTSLFLNEMPVTADVLMNTSMSDVAYVKVFQPPFMGSVGGGAGGAVAVYTRKGSESKPVEGKGLPYKMVAGYTPVKEFYSPNYGTFDERNEQADYRTTLYWNPTIVTTPENHRIRLTFYNNDITDSFRIIVEGMTTDGRLTSVEKVIE